MGIETEIIIRKIDEEIKKYSKRKFFNGWAMVFGYLWLFMKRMFFKGFLFMILSLLMSILLVKFDFFSRLIFRLDLMLNGLIGFKFLLLFFLVPNLIVALLSKSIYLKKLESCKNDMEKGKRKNCEKLFVPTGIRKPMFFAALALFFHLVGFLLILPLIIEAY